MDRGPFLISKKVDRYPPMPLHRTQRQPCLASDGCRTGIRSTGSAKCGSDRVQCPRPTLLGSVRGACPLPLSKVVDATKLIAEHSPAGPGALNARWIETSCCESRNATQRRQRGPWLRHLPCVGLKRTVERRRQIIAPVQRQTQITTLVPGARDFERAPLEECKRGIAHLFVALALLGSARDGNPSLQVIGARQWPEQVCQTA
jgi:hypothetical protein